MRHVRSVTPSQVEVELSSFPNNSKEVIVCLKEDQPNVATQPNHQSPHIIQVKSFLYLGSLEAAYSEPLLCRYQIGSLVDVSAQHPGQVTRERKCSCPCTCPLTIAHSRAKLSVRIETNDKEDITPYFKEINTFIHYHRLQQRNVLVYSNAGLNRAPTIIAQYLIQMEHQTFTSILANLTSLRPQLSIDRSFFTILQKLERKASRTNELAPSSVKPTSGIQKSVIKPLSFEQSVGIEMTHRVAHEKRLENKAARWPSNLHKTVALAWT